MTTVFFQFGQCISVAVGIASFRDEDRSLNVRLLMNVRPDTPASHHSGPSSVYTFGSLPVLSAEHREVA